MFLACSCVAILDSRFSLNMPYCLNLYLAQPSSQSAKRSTPSKISDKLVLL